MEPARTPKVGDVDGSHSPPSFLCAEQEKKKSGWAARDEHPSTSPASLQITPSTDRAAVRLPRVVFQDLTFANLSFCFSMVRAGVREPALEGLVHDVDAQLSPGTLHVLHPGSCGGDGAAGSVRSPSCARCARPAFAIFPRTPRVFLQACKEPSWGQSQGAWTSRWRVRAGHTPSYGC